MEWVTSILGLIGGGWGSFASILIGLVAAFVLYRMYVKAVQKKAHKDTKDNEAEQHGKDIKDNQKDSAQAKKDEQLSKDAEQKAIDALKNQGD